MSFICNIEKIDFKNVEGEIKELIVLFNLQDDYSNKLMKDYSFGMKKKIQIISNFILHKELMIIDEPTNGLDIRMILLIKDLIQKENKERQTTFIISSHNTSFLQDMCDKVLLFNHKKIDQTLIINSETNLDSEFIKSIKKYEK